MVSKGYVSPYKLRQMRVMSSLSTLGAVKVSPVADFAVMPGQAGLDFDGLIGIKVGDGQPQSAE